MRPATARDRLHAAIVALALCSTSVSIVVAGQPEGPQSAHDPSAAIAQRAGGNGTGERQAASSGSEATAAMRSFTDMVAEAAREQERMSATLQSQAQDCVETVDASVSDAAVADGATLPRGAVTAAEDPSSGEQPDGACGTPGMETAL